jgi:hypothetical protein
VQDVVAPARGRAVQALRLTLMSAPLCRGNLLLDVPVESARLELRVALIGGARGP